MDCKIVEENLSRFIENELSQKMQKEISIHIKHCSRCQKLKEKVENIMNFYPELDEDIPFFLKNRLYNIFESKNEKYVKNGYVQWIAAVVGTVILFLNLFYFTNIYPSANRILHLAIAEVEKFIVETSAFVEKITESKNSFLFGLGTDKSDIDEMDNQESPDKKGGQNG